MFGVLDHSELTPIQFVGMSGHVWCPASPWIMLEAPSSLEGLMPEFVRDNAGKAFEFMVESTNNERKSGGLPSIEEMFAGEWTL